MKRFDKYFIKIQQHDGSCELYGTWFNTYNAARKAMSALQIIYGDDVKLEISYVRI